MNDSSGSSQMLPNSPQKQAPNSVVSEKTSDPRSGPVWFCVMLCPSLTTLLTQSEHRLFLSRFCCKLRDKEEGLRQ